MLGLLKRGYNAVGPKPGMGLLLDPGLDVFSAGMMAAGADPKYRLGVGLEDFALGFGGSMLGRVAGRGVGKMFGLSGGALEGATNAGSMAVSMPAAMFGPRPQLDAMLKERQQRELGEQQQAQQPLDNLPGLAAPGGPEYNEEILRTRLIEAILAGGALGTDVLLQGRGGGLGSSFG